MRCSASAMWRSATISANSSSARRVMVVPCKRPAGIAFAARDKDTPGETGCDGQNDSAFPAAGERSDGPTILTQRLIDEWHSMLEGATSLGATGDHEGNACNIQGGPG